MKIKDLIPEYLRYLKSIGRSPVTVTGAKYDLKQFIDFLETEKIINIDELTEDVLSAYQEELTFRLSYRGTMLTQRSQAQLLGVVKGFTRYLTQKDYFLNDPAALIKLPKKPKSLPKEILSIEEVKQLMDATTMRTHSGYRNRLILEILYDTAIRRAELSRIKLNDLYLKPGYVHIKGKGNKDRVVPLSKRVCDMVQSYIISVRPHFLIKQDTPYLILNRWGNQMKGNGIWEIVKRCAKAANLKKNVTTHSLRHTCATHMLQNGAPVRHLQEMLGHESLESTQIYTHVTINDLKKVHAKYHPGEIINK